ncbi:hypothetical protein FH972_021973 [Carpinus fangiana]|uniref:Tim10-like domain-containing protein n=1 Tax=Carpinus fangiana TaxID=176857 RepID=A0A5N6KR93_9ROSI|nr:hypothetical protein FH972_021973 [Carpinus fangiana]
MEQKPTRKIKWRFPRQETILWRAAQTTPLPSFSIFARCSRRITDSEPKSSPLVTDHPYRATMSFLFGGRPQPTSAEKIAMAENELELIQDMYNKYDFPPSYLYAVFCVCLEEKHMADSSPTRLARACSSKCLPKDYREGDLNKGESVCIDRCVSKYMDVNIKIGEKMQNDAIAKGAGGPSAPGGGGMFGR